MSAECSTKVESKLAKFFSKSRKINSPFLFQLYKSFDQAKEEVEKLRLELYPNLYSSTSNEKDGSTLEPIAENANELTDTVSNNDLTEDTSEAFASDDEVRGPSRDEDEEDLDNSDEEEYLDEVKIVFGFY